MWSIKVVPIKLLTAILSYIQARAQGKVKAAHLRL